MFGSGRWRIEPSSENRGNLWLPIAAHAVINGVLGIRVLATQNWHLL